MAITTIAVLALLAFQIFLQPFELVLAERAAG
jgi:hypothetical protein